MLKVRPSVKISTGKKNLYGTLSTEELNFFFQDLRLRRDIRHFNQKGVRISCRALSKKCSRGLNQSVCEISRKSEVFEIDMIFWRSFSFHFSSIFLFGSTNFVTFIPVPTLILRDIQVYRSKGISTRVYVGNQYGVDLYIQVYRSQG